MSRPGIAVDEQIRQATEDGSLGAAQGYEPEATLTSKGARLSAGHTASRVLRCHHKRALTKGYGSRWIFEPRLTCANALRRVQYPAFSLVTGREESA